jgi:hypothetical protein
MSYRRIVIIFVAIVTCIVGGITLAVLFNGEHWKAIAIESINKELLTELSVKDVGISVWAEFPKVTVDLNDVILLGSVSHIGEAADTIIRAQRLRVAFSLWDVLFGEPSIDALIVEEALLHLYQHKNGTWNTRILAKNKNDNREGGANTRVSISQIILRDIEVVASTRKGDKYECQIGNAIVKDGDIDSSFSDFVITNGENRDLLMPLEGYFSTSYIMGEDGEVNVIIKDAVINNIAFNGKAQFDSEEDNEWNVSIESNGLETAELQSIWANQEVFKGWSYNGTASISLNVNQQQASLKWSLSQADFAVSPKITGLALNKTGNITASGTFDYSFKKSSIGLSLSTIQVNSNGIIIDAKADCSDLKLRPLSLSGSLNIDTQSSYSSWLPQLQTTEMSVLPDNGFLSIDGRLKISPEGNLYDIVASISSQQLEGSLNASPYLLTNLDAELKEGDLSLRSLKFDWGGNRGEVDAKLFGYEKWGKGGAISGTVNLKAESIVVGAILSWWDNFQPDGKVATQASLLPLGTELGVKILVDRLYWNNLECSSLTSRITVGASQLIIMNATAKGLEGSARVEGSLRPGGNGWILGLSGTADNLSLPNLFQTYNNFGQTTLRAEHIQGAVSAAGTIKLEWDLSGKWISEGLLSNLDVTVDHGRLINFEVFDEVADYLKDHRLIAPLVNPEDLRERLKDIEFSHLESPVFISSSSTTIPYLNIPSSAMNVSLEGVHAFSGQIDYTLGFALRDLRDTRQVEFGNIEDDKLGNMFFLAMDGTLKEPVYSYDREAHRAHRRKAISTEVDRLRNSIQGSSTNQDEDNGSNQDLEGSESDKKPKKGEKSKGLNDLDDEDF